MVVVVRLFCHASLCFVLRVCVHMFIVRKENTHTHCEIRSLIRSDRVIGNRSYGECVERLFSNASALRNYRHLV